MLVGPFYFMSQSNRSICHRNAKSNVDVYIYSKAISKRQVKRKSSRFNNIYI